MGGRLGKFLLAPPRPRASKEKPSVKKVDLLAKLCKSGTQLHFYSDSSRAIAEVFEPGVIGLDVHHKGLSVYLKPGDTVFMRLTHCQSPHKAIFDCNINNKKFGQFLLSLMHCDVFRVRPTEYGILLLPAYDLYKPEEEN